MNKMPISLLLIVIFGAVFSQITSEKEANENQPSSNETSQYEANGPLSEHLKEKNFAENEKFTTLSIENCIKTLLHIQMLPLLTTNCCLTKLCSNRFIYKRLLYENSTINELIRKLCGENLYLLKEQLSGCNFQNNLNIDVNNDTNFSFPRKNKKGKSVIANYSVNFRIATINDKTAQINSLSTGDLDLGSTGTALISLPSNSTTFDESNGDYFVTLNSGIVKDDEIKLEHITETSARNLLLQFLDVPKEDEMHIHDLRLNEKYLLFEAFSSLIGYIQPSGFPSELLRDSLKNQVPFHIFAFQLLKTEFVVLGWILFWAILSICLPFVIVTRLCCFKSNMERLNEDSSNISLNFKHRCTESTLGFLLHIILIIFLIPLILVLAGNEQISNYMMQSTQTVNIIFEDMNTFIRNTHMQITFVATSSTDITIEAIRKDLEDVENILGKPFQEDIAIETGINIALDGLDELKIAAGKVACFVSDLLNECESAQTAGSLLQDRLREISRQLTIARQQCLLKDRALCYTLLYTGFDVTFSTNNLTADLKIKHLERIGKERNFNNSIENARIIFEKVPERISMETASSIAEMKNLLSKRRTEVYKSAHNLDELARSLLESTRIGHHSALQLIQKASIWDLWRWLAILGIATMLSLVWGLLLCGAPCGCGLTSRTISFLISGISLSCIMCLVVWGLGSATFLVGGHCQSLLCQPLYDQPRYTTLGEIMDSGGILYREGGFFRMPNKLNGTLKIQNVLKNCQRNQPVYTTFHLNKLFDVNSVTNYKSWDDLKFLFGNLTLGENNLEILSPSLQLKLQVLSTISSLNLTSHRTKISKPVTKRDLNSFADQLNTVARQLSDLTTSKRIDNLAFMVRDVIHNEMQRMNALRDSILYKITTLEVFIQPLSKQANKSLAHLKNIQYFLDNERKEIAEKNSKRFISRIEYYLDELKNHTISQITKEIGKCRPLWDIFQSSRFYICKLLVDTLNGISFLSFFMILLFLAITPIIIKLLLLCREYNEEILSSITHRRTRDGLIIDDEGAWATPSSDSPDLSAGNALNETVPSSWTSPPPRQRSETFIPPPPRFPSQIPTSSRTKSPKRLSTIAARISAARVPHISSISRARSPKRGRHESLRLIEPICWKSGSFSPRNWM